MQRVNDSLVNLLECDSKEDVVESHLHALLPSTVSSLISAVEDCLLSGQADKKTSLRTLKSGKTIPIRLSIAIDRSCQSTWERAYITCSLLEPETLTSELAEMHHMFDAVLRGITMCVNELDQNGVWRRSMGSLLTKFNLKDNELIGENIYDRYPASLHETIRLGLSGQYVNFTDGSASRDGMANELGEDWTVRSYFLPGREGTAYLLSIDVTDLQQAQRRLERQTIELQRSHDEMTQFSQVVSHDLREPIRTVSLFTELLTGHLGDQIDDKTKHYLRTITDNADRMQTLISDLSRYNHIRPTEEINQIDLDLTLANVVSNLTSAIATSSAQIEIGSMPTVEGIESWFTLLFQNLLANAIKYKDDRQPHIRVSSEYNDHQWTFYIKDNGIGIEPQFHDRIFEIFRRLHSRDQFPGTGMGLAICKKIVTQWGGKIWVDSDGKNGSTFAFTFPLTPR